MPNAESTFYFESYRFDAGRKEARFVYSYDRELRFEEVLRFETPVEIDANTESVQVVLQQLHLALGMSYWKAYCPKQIVVESVQLTEKDVDFWNTVYTKGLGEFFYQNEIDFRGLVSFPITADEGVAEWEVEVMKQEHASEVHHHSADARTLVPLGGGKDSLTTVALLQEMQIPFETVALGSYSVVEQQVKQLGITHHRIHRIIDPALFELNANDPAALNGHVPISVIYALSALFISVAGGFRYLVLSNEQSANIGNVSYFNMEVNHQWSKSFEFETLLRELLERHHIAVEYFSLLRPLTEYSISEIFSQHFDQWAGRFTSCNRNFTQGKQNVVEGEERVYWCGTCPKCVFVFTMLAAWVPKEKLVAALGINPWDDATNEVLLRELLGLENWKPFECVGTPTEMLAGAEKMFARGEYQDDVLMKLYIELRRNLPLMHISDEAKKFSPQQHIPTQFQGYLTSLATTER